MTIITMKKVIPVAIMKRDIPAEEPAVVDVVHTSRHLQAPTEAKPAVPIIGELLTMEHSLILLMIVENRLNLSAEQDR